MVRLNDIVQRLIKRTNSGGLRWLIDHDNHWWIANHHDCLFIVYQNTELPKLVICWTDGGESHRQVFDHEDVVSLVICLTNRFPFVETTADDALLAAMNCLTKED